MGPVPTPSQWARVQLAQGDSTAGTWDLSSAVPEARVTVGSSPPAGWIIQADGVLPVHFELYWDGTSLWVSPPTSGNMTVDGERVQSWRQLAGTCRIEFGRAALMVESSQSIAMPGGAPAAAPGAQSQAMPAVPPPVPEIGAFDDDDATQMLAPGDNPLDNPLDGESTRMLEAPSAALPRPVFGGGSGKAGDVPRLGAPTVGPLFGGGGSDAPAAPHGEMHTQILDTEAFGLPPSRPPPPPGPALAPGIGVGSGTMGDQRPTLMGSPASTDIIPRGMDMSAAAEEAKKFAMPPIPDGSAPSSGLELPPRRTLILLGVTVLVTIVGVSIVSYKQSQEDEAAYAAAVIQRAQMQEQQAEIAAQERRAANEAIRAQREEREAAVRTTVEPAMTAIVERARAATAEGLPEDTTPEQLEAFARDRVRIALESRAAELVVNNNHPHALAFYQRLAEENAGNATYAQMIVVLRAKMR